MRGDGVFRRVRGVPAPDIDWKLLLATSINQTRPDNQADHDPLGPCLIARRLVVKYPWRRGWARAASIRLRCS